MSSAGHRENASGAKGKAASAVASLPSVGELRDAVPAHCFHRSLATSLAFVVRDGVLIAALFVLAWNLLPTTLFSSWQSVAAWAAYWFVQGSALTGWWVLAHECGHGAFSDSSVVNNAVGFVLHSVLFVPYFSWQYSHARHHAKTNHLLDGETHTPSTRKGFRPMLGLYRVLGDDGFAAFQVFTHLVLGWPLYLLFNNTGARRTYQGDRINGRVLDHFRPWSALFPPHWRLRVAASTTGLFAWLYVLFVIGQSIGHARVGLLYWGPYMVTNGWLVLYTWLQHTDPHVPHFGEDEWTWLKGAALGTVDRPYGIFDWMHHHIGSTHVTHHIFPRIPHYHAVEATVHIKRKLGALYNFNGQSIPQAMWEVGKQCHFVDGVEGVQFYKSAASLSSGKGRGAVAKPADGA